MANERPGISIIVPTHQRLSYLQRCVESLLAVDYGPFEIIVVDDFSTDGTQSYLEALVGQGVIILRNDRNLGVAATRNVGAKRAKYSILAFTDDDCVVDRGWLSALAAAFHDPAVAFAFGRTAYIRDHYRGYFPERLVTNGDGRWPGGGNIAYRRDVFLATGGFDPHYVFFNNEDTELAIRLVAEGHRFVRRPEAVVYHQAMHWTRASLLNSRRNASVWPALKRRYPRHFQTFGPDMLGGIVVAPRDYAYIVFFPLLWPLLFIRYLAHGGKPISLFFLKWPVWLVWRRVLIWREAWRQRVVMF